MENGHLCAGLYQKEQKKKTAREWITPGGAIKATGDDSMGVMQMIQAEKATAAQRQEKGKVCPLQEASRGTLPKEEAHKKWEGAIKTWLELRVELKKQGQYMKEAGNKPHLHDFLQANAPYHLKTTHLLHFPNPTVWFGHNIFLMTPMMSCHQIYIKTEVLQTRNVLTVHDS